VVADVPRVPKKVQELWPDSPWAHDDWWALWGHDDENELLEELRALREIKF
jgi:hypothetical protein